MRIGPIVVDFHPHSRLGCVMWARADRMKLGRVNRVAFAESETDPMHFQRCLLLGIFVSVFVGCGGEDENRVPVLPVRGKVLLDGEPAVGAYVEFRQKNPADASRKISPTCTVDEKGEYLLSTYAMGDGIPEGEYSVLVRWPIPDEMTEPESYPENWEYLREVYGDRENPQFEALIQKAPEDEELEAIVIPTFQLVSDENEELEE